MLENMFHIFQSVSTEEKDIARVINFESPWVEGSRTLELLDLPRFGCAFRVRIDAHRLHSHFAGFVCHGLGATA